MFGRSNDWGDILLTVVTNLVELSEEELNSLLERWPQLSIDELINLLGGNWGETTQSGPGG
ncbi:MAG: hypothetical protein HC849_00510 [Oscillatoriales cyanobacterium RU_3_3]|nr:hypothetical protein [Microcoleus sp. SU_5_3]NJM59014.1 hypothetical protein [Oscillatoriales cyanobacterium RU_3_3]